MAVCMQNQIVQIVLASAIIHIYSDEFLCKDLSKGSLELSENFKEISLLKSG